jgi:hypothetical protein
VPEHQQLLLAAARPGRDRRLEDRVQLRVPAQSAIASLMNSGPLSDLSTAGAPRTATRSSRWAVSPWHNGYVESFNSRLRDECLNINSFYSLLHAQVVIGDWNPSFGPVAVRVVGFQLMGALPSVVDRCEVSER